MSLRYFIEMAFYAALVAVFQYYITNFNSDMFNIGDDIDTLIDLGALRIGEDGRFMFPTSDERFMFPKLEGRKMRSAGPGQQK